MRQPIDPALRFWPRVQKTSTCWLWTGNTSKGYGSIEAEGKPVGVHRFSYQLATGKVPVLDVLHSCDNPRCVNPDHLTEGTHQQNMADRNAKGRGTSLLRTTGLLRVGRMKRCI
jgi:hypothetical protein